MSTKPSNEVILSFTHSILNTIKLEIPDLDQSQLQQIQNGLEQKLFSLYANSFLKGQSSRLPKTPRDEKSNKMKL